MHWMKENAGHSQGNCHRMKGAIDTEHQIQELVCAERSKHNLRGVPPEPDGQRARAMEEKGLHSQGPSWAIFGNALAFSSLHPLQVRSLPSPGYPGLRTPGSHFMDQVAAVLGLHEHTVLPRISHHVWKPSCTGNTPDFPLLIQGWILTATNPLGIQRSFWHSSQQEGREKGPMFRTHPASPPWWGSWAGRGFSPGLHRANPAPAGTGWDCWDVCMGSPSNSGYFMIFFGPHFLPSVHYVSRWVGRINLGFFWPASGHPYGYSLSEKLTPQSYWNSYTKPPSQAHFLLKRNAQAQQLTEIIIFFRLKSKPAFSLPRDALSPFHKTVWVGRNLKTHPAPTPVWYLDDSGASALCGVMGTTRQWRDSK